MTEKVKLQMLKFIKENANMLFLEMESDLKLFFFSNSAGINVWSCSVLPSSTVAPLSLLSFHCCSERLIRLKEGGIAEIVYLFFLIWKCHINLLQYNKCDVFGFTQKHAVKVLDPAYGDVGNRVIELSPLQGHLDDTY